MFWRFRHPGQAPQHRQQVPSDQTVRAPHSAHQLHPAEREHPWHTKEGPVRTATVESYAGICNSKSILKTLIFFFLYFESSVKFDCQSLPSLCSHPPDFYVLVCGHCTITYRCDFTFKLCYLLIFNNKKKREKSGWKQAFPFSCPLSWHLLHFTSLSLVWISHRWLKLQHIWSLSVINGVKTGVDRTLQSHYLLALVLNAFLLVPNC